MIIGIAGKTGAGKNYVASILEQKGWRILDLDPVGHRALDALSAEVEERLGPGLLSSDGSVNRRLLGERVFGSPQALQLLEGITYPWIEKQTRLWLEEQPDIPAAVHGVNLHKTSLVKDCRFILWVSAPLRTRRQRVMRRDSKGWKELLGRFRSQRRLGPKLFSRNAEIYKVRNSGNDRRLRRQLNRILSRLDTGSSGRGQ